MLFQIEEKLLFSGTDPDTIELAKSFWKSVTLQPPLESSLISTHIEQRLPKAPKLNPASNSKYIIAAGIFGLYLNMHFAHYCCSEILRNKWQKTKLSFNAVFPVLVNSRPHLLSRLLLRSYFFFTFLQFKEFELYWGAVFLRLEEEYWRSPFFKSILLE